MASATARALDEHRLRRARGVPTLSVLQGPPRLAWMEWRSWCAGAGRATVSTDKSELRAIVRELVDAQAGVLRSAALAHAASRAGVALETVGRAAAERGEDLSAILRGLGDGLEEACCRAVLAEPGPPGQALAELPPESVLAAIKGLRLALPAVFLRTGAEGVEAAARLADTAPDLDVALALASEEDLRAPPDSRAKSLAREGLIPSERIDLDSATRALAAAGVELVPGSLERLVREGATPALLDAFAKAALERGAAFTGDALEPGARSAQESFLFQRLDSLAETAGVFELNGKVRIESREAEVDLVSRDLRLAIEIDGYRHFQDPEAYRRDRRKDLELQRAGYLVLRFLADDVVARLESILDETLRAVSERRARQGTP